MAIVDPVRPTTRRLDASGPGTADVVGVRLTLAALLRWSPLIVVAALLGWVVGAAVPDLGRGASANVTLGLTDDVRWPFYDAVMARQPALLDTPEVREAAEAGVGVTADDVSLDLDTGQTDAVLRIVVEADTEAHAIALAQAMGERLVAVNLDEQRATIDERVARLEAAVAARQQELDELDERRDRERLALDTDAAEITQAQLLVVASALTDLESQLAEAREELGALGPRIDIVAPAVAGRNRADDVRSSAVVAALLGLLAVGLVPTLDRRFGRARSAVQLRRVWPGVPVIDERRGSDVLGDDLPAVVAGMSRAYADVVVLTPAAAVEERLRDTGATLAVLGRDDIAAKLGDAGAVVVVVPRGEVAVRRLDDVADALVALGIRPAAVVLAE